MNLIGVGLSILLAAGYSVYTAMLYHLCFETKAPVFIQVVLISVFLGGSCLIAGIAQDAWKGRKR